jgi:3-phenylpropionate/trans-cinnamate dioxygenase ferredoxin component
VGDGGADYRFAIPVREIARGRSRRCVIDGHAVLVCNVGGDFYALADTCTHDRGPLGEGRLRGHLIECPRHGSRFDVRDGDPKTPPAMRPVATYPVRIRDDAIEVLLPGS